MPAKKVTKTAKKTVAKTATVPAKQLTKSEGAAVLKAICQDLKLDPKTARRVLRKKMRSDVPEIAKFHELGNRWVQDANGTKIVRTVLKEYLSAQA